MSEADWTREREYFIKLCGFAPNEPGSCADLLDFIRSRGLRMEVLNEALANRYARLLDAQAVSKPAP